MSKTKIKTSLCFLLLAGFMASVFADVELNINYALLLSGADGEIYDDTEINIQSLEISPITEHTLSFSVTPFFFSIPIYAKNWVSVMDIGINFGYTRNIDGDAEFKIRSSSGSSSIRIFDVESVWITFAPAFRWQFHKMHSVYIAPGVAFGNIYMDDDYDCVHIPYCDAILFNVNIGYRLSFIHTQSFHMGLNLGAEYGRGSLSEMLYGNYTDNINIRNVEIKEGDFSRAKFYFGLTFDFGVRGLEKKINRRPLDSLPEYPAANAYVFDGKSQKLNFEEYVVFTNCTNSVLPGFEFHAYLTSENRWKLLGDVVLGVSGTTSKIDCGNADTMRYYAIVPKDGKSYSYSLSAKRDDLYISVRE